MTTPYDNLSMPKVFRALVSQVGTAAPTFLIIENTLCGAPVMVRTAVGQYALNDAGGPFDQDRTFFACIGGVDPPPIIHGGRVNQTSVRFDSHAIVSGLEADGLMVACSFLIQVFR